MYQRTTPALSDRRALMPTLAERWGQLFRSVKESSGEVIRSARIPADRVSDHLEYPRFQPRKHYFSVFIDEMFLATTRQWFNVYDPMALVVTEFTYDSKPIVLPFVVGPSMLEGKIEHVPNG